MFKAKLIQSQYKIQKPINKKTNRVKRMPKRI